MRAAIIGLPKSGKSTLFSAVTGVPVDPYAPPEPRSAMVPVFDPRLGFLTELCKPKKVVQATIEFVDVPGCSIDDPKGQREWRRLLPAVRQAELLVVVVGAFENQAESAPGSQSDPKADFETVWDELIFADLDAVTTRLDRLDAALKKPTKSHDAEKKEQALLVRCCDALESGAPLSTVLTTEEDRRRVSSFAFLTEKAILCVKNVSDDQAHVREGLSVEHVVGSVNLSASIEAEIAMLEPEDRAAFLKDLGLDAPASERLVQQCYRASGLISFLTMGSDEVRAWPLEKGATAVGAAAKIHSDLAHGFIRAETVAYEDLLAHKDMKGARAAGKVRKEGKSYIVQDGDIINILSSA